MKYMRVLIADDEKKVCQLILHLADWEEYDMEVIGMFNDGLEAYQAICNLKPDIVITDIHMPGIDGIELVEKSLQEVENVYFIIVSGYSQFEYARQAVKLGVEDYLLKPIKKKELESVLTKISSKHLETRKDRNERENLKTELLQTREKIKNNLLMDLMIYVTNDNPIPSKEEIYSKYGCTLSGKYSYFVIAHFYENALESNNDERSFVMMKIQRSLTEKLKKYCCEFLSIVYGNEVICLLNTDEYDGEKLSIQLKKANNEISSIREIFPAAKVAIGVGLPLEDIRLYKPSIERIDYALLSRFADEGGFIFYEKNDSGNLAEVSDIITANIRKRFLAEIELVNGEAVERMVLEIGHSMSRYLADGELIRKCGNEVSDMFAMGVRQYSDMEERSVGNIFIRSCGSFYNFSDVMEWMAQEFRSVVDRYEQSRREVESKPIRLAKQYITEHYNENISLEIVSGHIGLNPAYFSSVFKKTTNQNFMDYVTKIRMENAKLFLSQSNKDIADIANEVGYSDIKYFSRLFKKNANLTPSEYRKLYG